MSALLDKLLKKYKGSLPEDYVVAIVNLAEKHINRRFLNDSHFHAQLLIECMIGRAANADETRIYSGSLNADCFKEILNAGGQKIRILVDDIVAAEKTINSLDIQGGRIVVLPVLEKWTNHFFTVGDSYRYERDDGKAAAVANFNEPDVVSKLNLRFEKMWKAAEENKQRLSQLATVSA